MSGADTLSELLARMASPALPQIDLTLDRMMTLLEKLGNPHLRLPPVVHVAGTNGKGSTIAFLKSILEAAGLRVHRYTSPHLVTFHERIELAGKPITDEVLQHALTRVDTALKQCSATFFEATTAAAMLCFSEHEADVLLLEVGLGGRLDATNVVADPILTIITPVDYDHQDFLGTRLEQIASEKAGIIKRSVPCIVSAQQPEALEVIRAKAKQLHAPIFALGHGWQMQREDRGISVSYQHRTLKAATLGLAGDYQHVNAATAMAAAFALQERLKLSNDHIVHGIASARWPARLHTLQQGPLVEALPNRSVVLDGGHNPHAAAALARWLSGREGSSTLVVGMRTSKDAAEFLRILSQHVARIITVGIADTHDAYSPDELLRIAERVAPPHVALSSCHDVSGLAAALACDENTTVLIAGSLYLAGEVLKTHA